MMWPDGVRVLTALEETVSGSGVDPAVLHLVRIRASQLNGCTYCIDLHTGHAVDAGEDRVGALDDWRASASFSEPEQAALELTEALTQLPTDRAEQAFRRARMSYDEITLGKLVTAIAAINAWNRIGVAQRTAAPPA